jgi:hypothetical protein
VGNAHQNPPTVGNAHPTLLKIFQISIITVGNAHQNPPTVGNAHPTLLKIFQISIIVDSYIFHLSKNKLPKNRNL